MKVLHITPSYYPAVQYGGPVESVHLMNKALIKKGIDVYVLTTNSGIQEKVKANEWIDIDGVKVKYLKTYFYKHFTFSQSFFLRH